MGMGLPSTPGGSNTEMETTLEAIAGFFTQPYDHMVLTYVASGNGEGELETVTTKIGATTVQVLTLTYDSSDRLVDAVVT